MDKMSERRAAYGSVIEDLYAKRAELDRAIAALEAMLNAEPQLSPGESATPALSASPVQGRPRQFFGSQALAEETGGPLIAAIKAVLRASERPLGNVEIFRRLKEAGVEFRSANPQLSVSQALSRNARLFGEPVRVGRGRWALP